MNKNRLIPKLHLKRSRFLKDTYSLVTTIQFNKVIEIGDPVSQAKIYESQAVDELLFLDLDARVENRSTELSVVKKTSEVIFMPFTIGGGINTVEDIRNALSNGADKVSINTAAVKTPEFISKAATIFGKQCIVVSIDYKCDENDTYSVWINNGREKTILHPVDWAIQSEKLGAGEILLTSIDRDGTRKGLDVNITKLVTDAVSIPVITSGGCGLAAHFVEGFLRGNADAVAAGTYFCFKDENPMQTRSQMKNAGIPIRLHM